jgi:glycine/serine hydroxymethyltransferase
MATIGSLIDRAVVGRADDAALARVKGEVLELAEAFPLYGLPVRSLVGRA